MLKEFQRIEAFDLARFIALLGIILNHTLQSKTFDPFIQTMQDYHAVLFVLLMGFFAPKKESSMKKIFIKGFVLIGVGFALGSASIAIDVILVNLGIIFIVGSLIVRTINKTKYLIILALTWMILSPILSVILRRKFEEAVTPESMNFGTLMIQHAPEQLFVHPFLYSHYPVLQWISFFFVGAILSRILMNHKNVYESSLYDSMDKSVIKKMTITGFLFFVSAKIVSLLLGGELWKMDNGFSNAYQWSDLSNSGAYTGTTLGMISSIGIGLIIIALCMWLTSFKKVDKNGGTQSVIHVTPYLSGATLSLYAIHVYSFTVVPPDLLKDDVKVVLLLIATIVLLAVCALVWSKIGKRFNFTKPGPLEEFMFYLAK